MFSPAPLWSNGPIPGHNHEFPKIQTANGKPISHTMYPSTSGSSVIGLKYHGGVLIAADTKGSYGSLTRFMNLERLFKVTDEAVFACGGDIADYQFIRDIIEDKVREDECGGVKKKIDAGSLHCWLTRVLYNRRTKFDPLWLECVVGGYKDGKPYLGYVDKIGTAYEADQVTSGFALHLSLPMIREAREKCGEISKTEAKKVVHECMKVLYYRDCTAHFNYQVADITENGVTIEKVNFKKESNWEIAAGTMTS